MIDNSKNNNYKNNNIIQAVNTFDSVSMEEKNSELTVLREELEKVSKIKGRLAEYAKMSI